MPFNVSGIMQSVGVKAVQEAYAGRDFYDRMVGCVLTNQYFTQPAVDAAQKLKILLWDKRLSGRNDRGRDVKPWMKKAYYFKRDWKSLPTNPIPTASICLQDFVFGRAGCLP